MTFKPMLAVAAKEADLRFPLIASPKLDGVRCLIIDGKPVSRTLKPIPNDHVFTTLAGPALSGVDGELIVGDPTAPDCYRKTVSAVMSTDGEPDFAFYVFDRHDSPTAYTHRLSLLESLSHPNVVVLQQQVILTLEHLLVYETHALDQGYEGLILRKPTSPYKKGRSTLNEGFMLKLKRFEDSEAEVLEVVEAMENCNVAITNALGHTERSSHKENLKPKGTMGALRVRDIHHGWEFNIGTGFDEDEAAIWWRWHLEGRACGKLVKYQYFAVGMKDLPRFPSYKGLRAKEDM